MTIIKECLKSKPKYEEKLELQNRTYVIITQISPEHDIAAQSSSEHDIATQSSSEHDIAARSLPEHDIIQQISPEHAMIAQILPEDGKISTGSDKLETTRLSKEEEEEFQMWLKNEKHMKLSTRKLYVKIFRKLSNEGSLDDIVEFLQKVKMNEGRTSFVNKYWIARYWAEFKELEDIIQGIEELK